jgi:hypothetical protein
MRYPNICAVLLCTLLLVCGCGGGLAERLRETGIATEASIAFKRETGGKRHNYTFTLYYFAKDSADLVAEKQQESILKDSTISMVERLDRWDPSAGGIGEFMSVDIPVSGAVFDSHTEGDRIQVRYLPEDPQQVMLEEEL